MNRTENNADNSGWITVRTAPLWIVIIMVVASLGAAKANCQTNMLGRIVADWNGRREGIENVAATVIGQGAYPKSRLDDISPTFELKEPQSDHRYEVELQLTIDFRGNRVRKQRSDEAYGGSGKYSPSFQIDVFDGRTPLTLNEYDGRRTITLNGRDYRQSLGGGLLDYFDYPLFFAFGRVPTGSKNIDPGDLNSPMSVDDFEFHGSIDYGGTHAYLVRTKAQNSDLVHEFVVDAKHKSRILRWTMSMGKQVLGLVEINYSEEGNNDYPDSWRATTYLPGVDTSRVNRTELLKVQSLRTNVQLDESVFSIVYEPGMVVKDNVNRKGYRVAPDGKTLVPLIVEAKGGETRDDAGSLRLVTFLLVGLGAAAVLAMFVLFAIRRSRSLRSQKL